MNRVVLFEPEKPANVGNIIRTCVAFDLSLTIIGNLTFDLNDKSLRRAQRDYAIGFPIERVSSLDEFFSLHGKEKGFFVTRYSKNIYSSFDLSDSVHDRWFRFGRESTGIPKTILKEHLSQTRRIPRAINARSLNLSNSVALVRAEALRQQHFPNLATEETIKGEDYLEKWNKESIR